MASSSNSLPDNSTVFYNVFKQLEEDKKRYEKLNTLIKSFQQADNDKSQIIHALQEKPYLSALEQEYIEFLRLQCMQDWKNISACSELSIKVGHQIEEKQYFLENKCSVMTNMDSEEQAIVFAESADDFFFNGDRGKKDEDQYCTISFLKNDYKCCRTFWGVLLGYTQNNALWEIHVEAWIRRALVVHIKLIVKEPIRTMTRYAVVPPSFHDDFLDHSTWHRNCDFASGEMKPFLRWRSVDSVLIPVCCPDNNWFLIEYKVIENELFIYNRDKSAVPAAYMKQILEFYQQNILWFYRQSKNTGRTPVPVPHPDDQPNVYVMKLTQYPSSKAKSAIYVCMLIHYILRGENSEVVTDDVSDEQVSEFRKMMATVLYAKRTG